MKKIFLTIITLIAIQSLSFATYIGIGVRAGFNYANAISDNYSNLNLNSKVGFQGAAFVELGFSRIFSIVPEVVISQQGFTGKFAPNANQTNVNINYVNVPVLARWSLDLRIARIFVNAGPQFGVNTNVSYSGGNGTVGEYPTIRPDDFGIVVGGGAGLKMGTGQLFMDVRYTLGLTNINANAIQTANNGQANSLRNGILTISVGYMFKFGN